MKVSVVIPSRNEGNWLYRTVKSIRENTSCNPEIVHVNDASERPEPDLTKWGVKEVSLDRRQGAARARAIGFFAADPASDVLGTVDSHMLFGPGDALCGLIEENQRFITHKALPIDYNPSPWECGVHLEPDKITRLAQIAHDHDCFAYMSPARQGPATCFWMNDLLRVRYMTHYNAQGHIVGAPAKCPQMPYVLPSAAMNGGCYFGSRSAWERIGLYPQLSGLFGFEEEILCLLAAAQKIPILCATQLSPWHLFRGQGTDPVPCPYNTAPDKELENLAAVYRLAFSEKMWQARWKPLLATRTLPGRNAPVHPGILRRVEENVILALYRDSLQSDFALHDEDLLTELEARRLVDERVAHQ